MCGGHFHCKKIPLDYLHDVFSCEMLTKKFNSNGMGTDVLPPRQQESGWTQNKSGRPNLLRSSDASCPQKGDLMIKKLQDSNPFSSKNQSQRPFDLQAPILCLTTIYVVTSPARCDSLTCMLSFHHVFTSPTCIQHDSINNL